MHIGFITNPFGRILYVNQEWPDGKYIRMRGFPKKFKSILKDQCVRGRSFNKEELMLELL